MTIILMLTMFAIFLTIDYFMKKGKVTVEAPAVKPSLRRCSDHANLRGRF